jgi:hypothetical protein
LVVAALEDITALQNIACLSLDREGGDVDACARFRLVDQPEPDLGRGTVQCGDTGIV